MADNPHRSTGPRPKPFSRTTAPWILAACLVLVLLLAVVFYWPHLSSKIQRKLHLWNVFHYVLGTKYFDEVGYYDLYKAVLLADLEERRIFSPTTLTRDQHTYEKIPVKESLQSAREEGLRERFTDERWEMFKADMEIILRQRPDDFWKKPIADRGFNPSPV